MPKKNEPQTSNTSSVKGILQVSSTSQRCVGGSGGLSKGRIGAHIKAEEVGEHTWVCSFINGKCGIWKSMYKMDFTCRWLSILSLIQSFFLMIGVLALILHLWNISWKRPVHDFLLTVSSLTFSDLYCRFSLLLSSLRKKITFWRYFCFLAGSWRSRRLMIDQNTPTCNSRQSQASCLVPFPVFIKRYTAAPAGSCFVLNVSGISLLIKLLARRQTRVFPKTYLFL